MTLLSLLGSLPVTVNGLDDADRDTFAGLLAKLRAKEPRNRLRSLYFESKQALKDFGIALPPQFRDVEAVVGWPAKGVLSLSRRNVFQGITCTGADPEDLGLVDLYRDNMLAAKAPQAHTSALVHACAFTFVTNGDTAQGQPESLITVRSARDATGEWDAYSWSLSAALEVTGRDKHSQPTSYVLHFPGRYIIIEWDGKRWRAFERTHRFGMLAEALPYRPELNRPFGHSRITRPAMYYTDAAVRTMLRTEIGAEFYNAPQRYALGVEDDAFTDEEGNPIPAWVVMLGRLLTMSKDEDGDLPQVGQFAQQSMSPNVEQLRSIAMMFAGDQGIPVGSLGIVQDNPESAEAITARNEELGTEIEFWQKSTLGPTWRRQIIKAMRIIDDSPAAREAYRTIGVQWGRWSESSEVSQAQASVARVSAIPWLAETDIELERIGLSPEEIERAKAQHLRQQSRQSILALAGTPEPGAASLAAAAEA